VISTDHSSFSHKSLPEAVLIIPSPLMGEGKGGGEIRIAHSEKNLLHPKLSVLCDPLFLPLIKGG
jgi:hypothetical protein